jgi:hypothetical protein
MRPELMPWPDVVDLVREATWGGLSDDRLRELHEEIGALMCSPGMVDAIAETMRANQRLLDAMKTTK